MDAQNIGKFLVQLRKEQNLTQKEISILCNVTTQAVSKWERGESIPDVGLLERLSILYRISINEIINGEKKELYADNVKQKKIISAVNSVMVLIVYFFTFAKTDTTFIYGISSDLSVALKGYKLIFDGTYGIAVYMSWAVFAVLISHMIINIFVIAKIINRTDTLVSYLSGSSIAVIVISGISTFLPGFYIFPQLLIIISMVICLFVNTADKKEENLIKKLIKYNKLMKEENIPNELLLNERIRSGKLIKSIRILILAAISIYFALAILTIAAYFIIRPNHTDTHEELTGLLAFAIFMIPGIISLFLKKYIGSVYTPKILIIIGSVILIPPLLAAVTGGGGGPFNFDHAVILTVAIIWSMIFMISLRLNKIIKANKS
jgi:transcriptional regulator with XRE-family HTH domain